MIKEQESAMLTNLMFSGIIGNMRSITEAADESKLTHLEHPEDHMLNAGYAGYHHAVNSLTQAHHILSGKETESKTSEKYDGSPSIVFGHHPETGRFFVASKSAFNVNPKINYTEADVDGNHGHAPGLAAKLKTALKHLPKIMPKKKSSKGEIYQGDVMYSKDGKDSDVTTKGSKHHFTPNTITYSTDKNSEEGKKISKAKLGVAIHTRYKGKNFEDLKAEYNPNLGDLSEHSDVHAILPGQKIDPKKYSPTDRTKFTAALKKADDAYKGVDQSPKPEVEKHHANFKSYLNQTINAQGSPTVEGYKKWSGDKAKKEIDKVKTPAVKAAKLAQHNVAMNHVDSNKQHFDALIETHKHLVTAKNILVKNFNQSAKFETHVGDTPVKTEGTVISVNNRPSKLNDREEFNRLNALKSKNAKQSTEKKPETANKHVTFAFGRMNPPTTGHEKVVQKMHDVAKEKGGDIKLVVSHSQDSSKNPLSAEQKLKHVKKFFPTTPTEAATKEAPTFLHHLAKLHEQGYKHVTMVAGSDRADEYKKLIHKYNGVKGAHGYFNFDKAEVQSSGERDPDAEGAEGMSASKMREHAKKGNFAEFKKGVPRHVPEKHAKDMYNDVRKGMGLTESLSFMKFFNTK